VTQSLERIKLNYNFPNKDPANRVMPGVAQIWVEKPGLGSTPDFGDSGGRTYFTQKLDPRFAPSYVPELGALRPLTFDEASGDPALILSNLSDDADKPNHINFRNHAVYIPTGVKLAPGDEFYRIRFYQRLQQPSSGDSQPEPKIAAEVIIVYNPCDTDSWTSGLEPHRLMHAGVRHIQWQGYTYKTPLYDIYTGAALIHTSLSIQGISLEDLDQIHDLTNRSPMVVIDIAQQDLAEDKAAQEALGLTSPAPPTGNQTRGRG
jgi:hypothetical protein